MVGSFEIDHLRLKPGIFVSRRDKFGPTDLTTFDLRFKEPNKEPVMDQCVLHTFEHVGATFLRSHKEWGPRIVYFGPMGCRTGFYVIIEGELNSEDVLPVMREMCDWIMAFEGPTVPGAAAAQCGNWLEHNLDMAKYETERYAAVLKNPGKENLNYPAL